VCTGVLVVDKKTILREAAAIIREDALRKLNQGDCDHRYIPGTICTEFQQGRLAVAFELERLAALE